MGQKPYILMNKSESTLFNFSRIGNTIKIKLKKILKKLLSIRWAESGLQR